MIGERGKTAVEGRVTHARGTGADSERLEKIAFDSRIDFFSEFHADFGSDLWLCIPMSDSCICFLIFC